MLVHTVPVLGDNYAYLIVCEQTRQAAAVDPADARAVERAVAEQNIELVAIWNTHHHADHTAGNGDIARRHAVSVVGHRADAGSIPGLTHALDHGDTIALGQLRARILHTPGHTRGAACYLVEDALFTGDTLFAAGCGRLFEGDPPTMHTSLYQVLRPLPAETRIYCGHEYTEKNLSFALTVEPDNEATQARLDKVRAQRSRGEPTVPFSLAEELRTNPFLRCESPDIRRALDEELDSLGVFARLRELRNVF